MSTSTSDPAWLGESTRAVAGQRALLAGMVLVAALVFALPLGERPIWNQDEARVALLAQDTLQHGPRLPAHVRGTPYLNKPPLYFWSVALVSWPAGRVSESTAAIPSVVAALATMLGVYAIGAHLSGSNTGLLALALIATSPGFFLHSHQVLPDMALVAWLTWMLYFLLRALRASPPRPVHLVGLYACLAGALWTKGSPALLALPAGAAAVVAARGWRGLRELRPLVGLALVTLAVLPWAIPYLMAPGLAGSQTSAGTALTWYLDQHRRVSSIPFTGGLATFLPWALWLPLAAVWWRRAPEESAAYRPLGAWLLVTLGLIALSAQQRSRYLLPAYPVFALLIAAAVTGPRAGARLFRGISVAVVLGLVGAALVLGGWLVLGRGRSGEQTPLALSLDVSREGGWLVLLFLGGLVLALRTLWRGGSPAGALGWIAGALGLVLLIEAWMYPARLAAYAPIRAFAEAARPRLEPGNPVLAYPDASMAFDLYLDHPVHEVLSRAVVVTTLDHPAASTLLIRETTWAALHSSAHASWCVLARGDIAGREYVLAGACE